MGPILLLGNEAPVSLYGGYGTVFGLTCTFCGNPELGVASSLTAKLTAEYWEGFLSSGGFVKL